MNSVDLRFGDVLTLQKTDWIVTACNDDPRFNYKLVDARGRHAKPSDLRDGTYKHTRDGRRVTDSLLFGRDLPKQI